LFIWGDTGIGVQFFNHPCLVSYVGFKRSLTAGSGEAGCLGIQPAQVSIRPEHPAYANLPTHSVL